MKVWIDSEGTKTSCGRSFVFSSLFRLRYKNYDVTDRRDKLGTLPAEATL
jgi:hypothetical protein